MRRAAFLGGPLVVIAIAGVVVLGGLLAGISSTSDLVRATSACFIGVYVLALFAAVRILDGRTRVGAAVTLALMVVLAVFSSWFLFVPAAAAVIALALRSALRRDSILARD